MPARAVSRSPNGERPKREFSAAGSRCRERITSQAPQGMSTRLAPQMRAKAMSKGVSDRPAEARAITMKAVQTRTVTTAAPRPMARAENRGAAGIGGLSVHPQVGSLRVAAHPLSGGNTGGPAKPVPRCFWYGGRDNPQMLSLLLGLGRASRLLPIAFALTLAPLHAAAQALPNEVDAALARAKVPRDAVTMLVVDAEGVGRPRLAWRTQAQVNPASIMKLVTTYAALDLLGPAFTWTTPVYVDGPVRNGVLEGNLYIKGQGGPTLVLEALRLRLRCVPGLGSHTL